MEDINKKISREERLRSVKLIEPDNIDQENPSNKIAERRKNKIFNTSFQKTKMHDQNLRIKKLKLISRERYNVKIIRRKKKEKIR